MRLIDADKLKLILNKKIDAALKQTENCLGEIECHRFEAAIMAFKDCISSVNAQPTVDAVPVVRCESCRFFKGDGLECHHSGMFAYEDDYCSNGERGKADG